MFCDRGTPSKDPHQFTIYRAIKDELAARGMPASAVRFVHEARNPAQLKALFAQCNRGLFFDVTATTEKMGTGTNVQFHLTALHHVSTCPGALPTSNNARAESCARATRTRKSTSSTIAPNPATTP